MNRVFLVTFFLGLAALSLSQDSFRVERKYVAGEKDSYQYKISIESAAGSIDLSMAQSQTVTKVYENGDADIEYVVSDMKIAFNGQEVTPPEGGAGPQKYTMRVNKSGQVVSGHAPGGRGGMQFIRFMTMGSDRAMSVGQTVPVDWTDPSSSGQKVKGTMRLDSIASGMAKVIANLEITLPQAGDKPMKLVLNAYFSTATSKLEKAEGTATDLPSQGGFEVKAMQISASRVKS